MGNKKINNQQISVPNQQKKNNQQISVPNQQKKNNNQYISDKITLIKDPSILKNNNDFPSFIYHGGDGFKCIIMTLKPNEQIRADGGVMNYMSHDIDILTTTGGNVFGAFGRLLSGSTFFYNIFENKGNKNSDISMAGINPGDVGCFYVPVGKTFYIVSDTYICSTPNLTINTGLRFGGILLGYGLAFVSVTATDKPGLVWIASFGSVIEITLNPNDSIKIDNGVLLGFEYDININTRLVGGIKSTLFSDEGLISEIINNKEYPIKLYLQARSKSAYLNYISSLCVCTSNSGHISNGINHISSSLFGGKTNKKPKVKTDKKPKVKTDK
jgi:uncharacterized protein (TIGR00266 family)